MRHSVISITAVFLFGGCAGGAGPAGQSPADSARLAESAPGQEITKPGASDLTSGRGQEHVGAPAENEFHIKNSKTARSAHGSQPSKIKATQTHAAIKFFVVDKAQNSPSAGIVISLQGPDGKKYYTLETDELGYAEVLVPVGTTYELAYLSLGEKDISARVTVSDAPRQNIKLTLRYKRRVRRPSRAPRVTSPATQEPTPITPVAPVQPVFRLKGVVFDNNSSEILSSSLLRLDSVVEYMTHKPGARIEIAGHTDSVGNAKKNKALSLARAQACRDYLIGKGVDGARIEALGYGDERPIDTNRSAEGRAKNRRIEAREL